MLALKIIKTGMLVITLAISLVSCSTIDINVKNGNRKYSQVTNVPKLTVSKKVIRKIISVDNSSYIHKKESSNIKPVFDGKSLFIASPNGRIFAKSIHGKELWDRQTKHHIIGGLSYDAVTKTLVFSTKTGLVVALDGKTGTLMWQRQLTGSIIAPAAINYRENRVVLSSNNGMLYGLQRKTGMPVWSYTTPTPNISIRGTAKPVIKKDIAVFAAADGRVYLLNVADGLLIWSKQVGAFNLTDKDRNNPVMKRVDYMRDIDSPPVFDGRYMYTATESGHLIALDLSSKQIAFSHQLQVVKQPLVVKNMLVVATDDGIVYAYDKTTGRLLWKNSQLQYRELTNPEFMSRHIIVGDSKGYLHLLNVVTGKIVSREKLNGQLEYLTVNANKLMVQTNNNISLWQ